MFLYLHRLSLQASKLLDHHNLQTLKLWILEYELLLIPELAFWFWFGRLAAIFKQPVLDLAKVLECSYAIV
jgi:hypothetical protein